MFRTIADGLLAVALAPACASCGTALDEPTRGPVCGRCWHGVVEFTPPLCMQCGDPLPSWRVISVEASRCARCRRRSSALSCIRSIGDYDGSLRAIVHALKYGGRRSLAVSLAERMRLSCRDALAAADVVVPVPLHRRRQRARGFNQAEELARRLGPPVCLALKRVRPTPSQTDLPAAQRHKNVRGAFRLRWRANVKGLRVVLVDDVCTTGATLEACAAVLRSAGARDVRAVTAARVVSRPPG